MWSFLLNGQFLIGIFKFTAEFFPLSFQLALETGLGRKLIYLLNGLVSRILGLPKNPLRFLVGI